MWNAQLDEFHTGLNKTAGRNIDNLWYTDDTTLMAENKEELKSLLTKVKESENPGLKLVPALHGKQTGKKWQILFCWAPKTLWTVTAATKLKDTCSLEKTYDKPRQHIKKQSHHFADKGPHSQSYGFSRSHHVQMWELDLKKAEHWRIDAFELWCWRSLSKPLDSKEIKLVNTKGNQPWRFIGRTEAPILWPPDVKSGLIGNITWCWERLKAGGEGSDRGWEGWMASPDSMWRTGKPEVAKSRTRLSDWTITNDVHYEFF